jgi:hypothetical protein
MMGLIISGPVAFPAASLKLDTDTWASWTAPGSLAEVTSPSVANGFKAYTTTGAAEGLTMAAATAIDLT